MTEHPKEPSTAELLERIEKLEAENVRSKNLSIRLARQIGNLINQVGTLDLHFIEVADKVFPGYRETQRQIMEICEALPPGE
jgi:hypothetical protein